MAEVAQILCPICHKGNLRRARYCQHCGGDIVLNNDSPSDKLRYVITKVIKQGGQGAVYEGIDESGQVYAIKEMLDSKFADDKERAEAIQRFNEEAQLLQGLSHPRIPRIYSHFTDEGRHYLTMDFVRGEDLEEIIEREGKIAEPRVMEWADQICDVLAYLHGKSLVYRDMKPSNVMIEREGGGVKLVDFGIAKLFKPAERGTQIGTPGYAPPEQYQGLATPVSDVYALGATLHHLLTGRDPTENMPFSFPPARSLVPTIAPHVSAALERALLKVPQDRFQTIQDFWAALRPERAQRPAQVRVAQPTVPLPAAAQVGVPAAAQRGTATASPRTPPPPPAPAPQRAQPQPRPQPQPPAQPAQRPPVAQPKPRPQGGGFLRTVQSFVTMVFVLALVAAIGLGGYVYLARPAWAEPFVGLFLPGAPTALPTSGPALSSRQVSFELEIQVPSGSDAATIRSAFIAAFEAQAQAQYGAATRVNMNVPPSAVGGQAVLVGESGGVATYRATFQGFVFTP